jgi:hypothetical protein
VSSEQQPPGDPPPTSALEEWERAERRMEERSAVRGHELERIHARRARRERYELPLRAVGLGALGALVLLVAVQAGGGDLSGVPGLLATLIALVLLLGPAVVAARLGRSEGWPTALALGVCAFGVELVLVFGVGFALLGLGPE